MSTVPADFSISYTCREASIPPPYYSQYSISIDASGAGDITFQPDYDFNQPPTWRRTFTVPEAILVRLHVLLSDRDVLDRDWASTDSLMVSGRARVAEIVASGAHTTIPAHPSPQDTALAEEVFSAIEGVVDQQVWHDLRERQAAYQASYVKKD